MTAKAVAEKPGKKRQSSKTKDKGKAKAAAKEIIPIPAQNNDEDVELSEEDLDVFEEYGPALAFLNRLDEKGIARWVCLLSR